MDGNLYKRLAEGTIDKERLRALYGYCALEATLKEAEIPKKVAELDKQLGV